jgi:hypothetical protein
LNRRHVGSLQQPLTIDVGVEKTAEERLELVDGGNGSEWQRSAPGVDDHVAGLAVDRGDEALGTKAPGELLCEGQIDGAPREERRSDDGVCGAAFDHFQRAGH